MKIYFRLMFAAWSIVVFTGVAVAIPPPDFLFNIGSQVGQIFSVIAVFLSVIIVSAKQFAKTYFLHIRHKKLVWSVLALVVAGLSYWGASWYQGEKQTQAYLQWVAESQQESEGVEFDEYEIDKLKAVDVAVSESATIEKIQRYDDNEEFILKYYRDIASGNLSEAYEVSKKSVSFAVFQEWYENVESVKVDNLQKIDDDTYSFRVKITERGSDTYYGVLMDVGQDENGERKVLTSDAKVLDDVSENRVVLAEASGSTSGSFFENNKDLPMAITNSAFALVSAGAYVLDAREAEEFEIGYYSGSNHVRFADLIAGEWIKVPDDEVVYVFCWSGIRGREVAEFLRTKGIVARYVKTGADGWVSYGGKWNGGIKFTVAHPEVRFQKTFSTAEVKNKLAEGVVIVDSRPAAKYDKGHVPGSLNIPVIYTPTSKMSDVLGLVPPGSAIITVCDDFVSCFDAKLGGLKLERLGHTFLGRYNRPWEYK